jgi:glycosyltransferase involved in cell wall biosynthesis
LEHIDIYFSPLYTAPEEVLNIQHIKHFIFLHDMIPILFPQDYPEIVNNKCHWLHKITNAISENNYYFCNSESTKNDFIRHFYNKLDIKKIYVSYISSSNNFSPINNKEIFSNTLNKYGVNHNENNKYIFSFCTLEPRKNILFTIQCFYKFINMYNINDLYYFLGGAQLKQYKKQLEKLINTFNDHRNKIIKLGYVNDEDVNIFYSNSLLFVFLSKYEGFGMPVLEAMQAGTPVICSNNSSLPEVAGNAAIMIDYNDEEACINAFKYFYFNENLRQEYILKGIERTKLFSWEKTCKIINDKIFEVVHTKND